MIEHRAPDAHLEGERLHVLERMIVAPSDGIFHPAHCAAGDRLEAGAEIGSVDGPGSSVVIVSPFSGELAGFLAHPGERLREGQAVAWIRMA